MLPPLPIGAKISFEASLSVLVGGERKSSLKGSFFSRGLSCFVAPSVFASAARHSKNHINKFMQILTPAYDFPQFPVFGSSPIFKERLVEVVE